MSHISTDTDPQNSTASQPDAAGTPPRSDWFTIPAPLARLFKRFPLVTYPANDLPSRSPSARHLPTLYVFVSDEDDREGGPSFNPSCLKWQTFLKLAGVQFQIVPSSNHASPTGALPFLIPPSTAGDADSQVPIPSNKLEQWALDQRSEKVPDVPSLRLEAYQSLLDHRIRNAWLYSLYLSQANSQLLKDLYIAPVSTSWAVQTTVLYQLRRAAEAEILQSAGATVADPSTLYRGAEQAFEALAAALGSDDWFFGNSGPGLFDAALFAYTHLLLDASLKWEDTRLKDALQRNTSLVNHRDRILVKCWPSMCRKNS
ncbi:putative mitochondrial outer membrane protein [Xylariales sp. AK1849]|nr:putative mitochondrial outer membrane protein [Xylariales sp. AK1849]